MNSRTIWLIITLTALAWVYPIYTTISRPHMVYTAPALPTQSRDIVECEVSIERSYQFDLSMYGDSARPQIEGAHQAALKYCAGRFGIDTF